MEEIQQKKKPFQKRIEEEMDLERKLGEEEKKQWQYQ